MGFTSHQQMHGEAPPHPLAGPVPYPGSLPSPRRGGGGLGFADHGYYLSDDDDDDDGSSSSENGGDDCDAGEDGDGRSPQQPLTKTRMTQQDNLLDATSSTRSDVEIAVPANEDGYEVGIRLP